MEWLTAASSLTGGSSSDPSQSSGGATGAPVSVGGLNITEKSDNTGLLVAALVGMALVWIIKR